MSDERLTEIRRPVPYGAAGVFELVRQKAELLAEVERLRAEECLSVGQRLVLTFVRGHFAEHGHAPLNREICAGAHVSPASAHKHLRALHRRGFLTHHEGIPRGIELLPAGGAAS